MLCTRPDLFIKCTRTSLRLQPNRINISAVRVTSILQRKSSSTVQEQDKIVTVPNLLCLGRIGASPYLAYSIVNGELVQSLGIFCLAGVSDLVSQSRGGVLRMAHP